MVKISFLADHLDAIPILAKWFRAQWPDYYARRTLSDIELGFREEAHRHRLPVRLVAFADGELAGTIVLRDRAVPILPESHPGLGGLFVPSKHRTCGIGTELVRVGMNVAREQGYGTVYAATAVAGGILKRLGWAVVRGVAHNDERLTLYRCELETRRPPINSTD
jgi:GNAT superfamily N-acetyltransferase